MLPLLASTNDDGVGGVVGGFFGFVFVVWPVALLLLVILCRKRPDSEAEHYADSIHLPRPTNGAPDD